MMSDDRNHGIRKRNGRENVSSNTCVEFHFLEFSRRQGAWFVQNVLWNRKLTHVMQKSGCFHCSNQFVVTHPHSFCQGNRVGLNTTDVPVGNLVLGIDRHR